MSKYVKIGSQVEGEMWKSGKDGEKPKEKRSSAGSNYREKMYHDENEKE